MDDKEMGRAEKGKMTRDVGKRCSYLHQTDRALQGGMLSLMTPVEANPNQEGLDWLVCSVLTQLNH